jgi:NAD(P)-dependent dehydrogenase (short-subunit alcohol dehydrogenase family)
MAVSMKQFGIRVNLVAPGRVKATQDSMEGDNIGAEWENNESDINVHATNRAGMPEDITEACEYLLGAGFVTGQSLVVDGGVSIMKNS